MESESVSASEPLYHIVIALYFAVFFVVARFLLDKFVFRRVAIWLLSKGSTPLKFNEATQAKILKCSESLWKLIYYATVEAWVLRVTYQEPWFTDTKEYFRGWPTQELKLPLKLFYMCQCGFYIYSITSLLTWETRRKDFAVMMSHHVITVILIGYSYITRLVSIIEGLGLSKIGVAVSAYGTLTCEKKRGGESLNMYTAGHILNSWCIWLELTSCLFLESSDLMQYTLWRVENVCISKATKTTGRTYQRFFRIGSIVLALHDASDIFMEAAKIFKYSEKELGASIFFGLFAISWVILRLIFFPFWVIRASSYLMGDYLNLLELYPRSLYYVFNTMLLMLLVFHVYWWILICAMIMRQLKNKGKVGEDIRSDSEDDD